MSRDTPRPDAQLELRLAAPPSVERLGLLSAHQRDVLAFWGECETPIDRPVMFVTLVDDGDPVASALRGEDSRHGDVNLCLVGAKQASKHRVAKWLHEGVESAIRRARAGTLFVVIVANGGSTAGYVYATRDRGPRRFTIAPRFLSTRDLERAGLIPIPLGFMRDKRTSAEAT